MKSLTVIMTALNEQDNIQQAITQMHQALSSVLSDFLIVVIDDGSIDETYKLATELKLSHVKVLRNFINLGTGKSIRNYLPYLETDFYCWYPTDLELKPQEITKAISLIGEFDIIVSYLVGDKRTNKRRLLSHLFTQILNLSFGADLKYYNGVSIIKKEYLPQAELINSRRFFTHAEILILSLNENAKVTSIGFNLYPRASGDSKAMKLNALMDVIINYVRLVFKKMRL